MILSIVPELTDEIIATAPVNVKLLDYKTFNSIEVHPFIATNNWEYVEVFISRGIVGGYIKQILSVGNIVVARVPRDLVVDYEIISRLGEVYPNSAAKLKKAYMQKQDIIPILLEEGAKIE